MKKILILMAILIGWSSCEFSREWELDTTDEFILVVDAILTDEIKTQEVKLSKVVQNLNDSVPGVRGAAVTVFSNGINYNFQEDLIRPGTYISTEPFEVNRNLDYILTISHEGKTYSATSRLSSVAPIPIVPFVPFLNTDSLQIGEFASPYTVGQQAMYEVDVNWSHIVPGTNSNARLYYYSFDEINIANFSRPNRVVTAFPKGSIVIIRKYGLDDAFANFLRSKVIETDWNGTLFYGTAENLPTNLDNGAVGFFSTCAILTDTLIAE